MKKNKNKIDNLLFNITKLYPKYIDLNLFRLEKLLQKLDNPQNKLPPVIHIAGTNGKGTLCAFLSSAAANSGLKVGLFTTPHLVVIEERVRIDGEVINSRTFDDHLATVRAAAVEVGLHTTVPAQAPSDGAVGRG